MTLDDAKGRIHARLGRLKIEQGRRSKAYDEAEGDSPEEEAAGYDLDLITLRMHELQLCLELLESVQVEP